MIDNSVADVWSTTDKPAAEHAIIPTNATRRPTPALHATANPCRVAFATDSKLVGPWQHVKSEAGWN